MAVLFNLTATGNGPNILKATHSIVYPTPILLLYLGSMSVSKAEPTTLRVVNASTNKATLHSLKAYGNGFLVSQSYQPYFTERKKNRRRRNPSARFGANNKEELRNCVLTK